MAATIQSMKSVCRKSRFLDLVLVAFFLVSSACVSVAHDAPATVAMPLGWSYDASCCSNKDCRPIAQQLVIGTGNGWAVLGQVIPYTSHKLRLSPDGEFHVCSFRMNESGETQTIIRCLYAPGMGS